MFPVRELNKLVPPGFTVLEDEDFVTLRCTYCGEEVIFYCGRVTPGSVQAAAATHYRICPTWHGPRE